jgi:formate dehydrogenase major subunit
VAAFVRNKYFYARAATEGRPYNNAREISREISALTFVVVGPSLALYPFQLVPSENRSDAEVWSMDISRRSFIKTSLIGGAGVSVFGFNLAPVYAQTQGLKIERTSETRSICPYCSVSCGVIIHTLGDKAKNAIPQVVHVEGDPDAPINRGTLCPKGASLEQDIVNSRRLVKPQVRRPGGTEWEDISWDQAVDDIARWIKKTRDATFIEKDEDGRTVNRLETIGWIGGCTDTNELNFLAVKTMRSMGLCYFETQARV